MKLAHSNKYLRNQELKDLLIERSAFSSTRVESSIRMTEEQQERIKYVNSRIRELIDKL